MPSQKASTASARFSETICGKCLVAYDTYIFLVVFLEFLGESVGAQEGGFDVHRAKGAKLSGDPEHFDFRLDVQTIARLDFNGGHPFGQKRFESTQCGFE